VKVLLNKETDGNLFFHSLPNLLY